ncbi:MAG: dipicolinate synthase subunit DpsA [Clostridiales bacterium]|nr:dipicolinate synthase subunit DpsA [Clostridiales bacterium]
MKKNDIRTFGIVGGDKRQLFLGKSISDSCCDVIMGGFDKLQSTGALTLADVKTAVLESDAVIFPLPSVRGDSSINTPFSDRTVILDKEEQSSLIHKPVFVAMKDKFLRAYPSLADARVFDYAARDEFAILNALPTAEGALECAIREYEGTISGSRCLITGFGRIGKILAKTLRALDAEVTVSARRQDDFAYISALGYKAENTSALKSVRGYDIVFNTVPALIFDRALLMNTDTNTFIIDLASLPGGVDFEAAHKFNIDAVRALSLPGKCAPKIAGQIIKTTVFTIIEEVYG